MKIGEIIEAVRAELSEKLPPRIEAAGIPDFSWYAVGFPDNQDSKFCCVRLAAVKENTSLEFIIHLALPREPEDAAYKYFEAVREYLNDDFEAYVFGYDTREWQLQLFETDFASGDIQALFSVTMNRAPDDCG
jgi:hypothetical protein